MGDNQYRYAIKLRLCYSTFFSSGNVMIKNQPDIADLYSMCKAYMGQDFNPNGISVQYVGTHAKKTNFTNQFTNRN